MVAISNYEIVIKRHRKQHYFTYFNRKSGFFARVEEKGYPEAFWSKDGPELLDISITNWCDKECSICYRNSSKKGEHIDLHDYEFLIEQAEEIGVLQVALGGGNPNQHPDFVKILEITREKYGIVPSYTTNGKGLTKKVLEASGKYCGAVAVSAYAPYDEMKTALETLNKFHIKTNVHFVLSSESIETAMKWLKNLPRFLKDINAVIFLNYKPVGKYKNRDLLLSRSQALESFFSLISNEKFPFKIGFDSCCISGLVTHLNVNPSFYEACEAGRFSAFISEEMKMYPCSFMIELAEGIDLGSYKIIDIWQKGEMFNQIRENLKKNDCSNNCHYFSNCLGGCPSFKEINLCNIIRSGVNS